MPGPGSGETSAAQDQVANLPKEGPRIDAPAAYGGLTRMVRRLSGRLTRHQMPHQRAVIDALHHGLVGLAGDIAGVDGRVEGGEARLVRLELRVAGLLDQVRGAAATEDGGRAADEAGYWRRRLLQVWAQSGAVPPGELASPPVRLHTSVGPLLVASHDRVMLPLLRDEGWWEDDECDQLRAFLRPGMTFVDVGAHVGFMTLLGARAVGPAGRVLSVEPAPANLALLRANVMVNGLSNVEVLPVAALDRTGTTRLSLSEFNTGDHRAYEVPSTEAVEVVALALDDVIPPDVAVDVVKVDAQGTDHLAILGMRRTLARSHSVLLVEFWPAGITESGADPLDVLRVYRDLGYETRVLGAAEQESPPPPEGVVDDALSTRGGFCSLILRPGR